VNTKSDICEHRRSFHEEYVAPKLFSGEQYSATISMTRQGVLKGKFLSQFDFQFDFFEFNFEVIGFSNGDFF